MEVIHYVFFPVAYLNRNFFDPHPFYLTVSGFLSAFTLLNIIPLYGYTTIYLPIQLLMDI